MVDGYKILVKDKSTVERMAVNPLFEYIAEVNETTGEEIRKTAKYKSLEIIIFASDRAIINGSLHKFHNDGKHNYDDFNRNQLRQSIINLELIFGGEILQSKIEHIEIGVNITPPVPTANLIDKILMYGRVPFKEGTFIDSNYKEAALQQFFLKAYDKGYQYKLEESIFRWEYKTRKMKPLNNMGLYYLGDLLKDEIYLKLGRILLDSWHKVLIIEDSIKIDELKPKEDKDLNKWRNPMCWKEITTSPNPKKFNQELQRYKKVVANHSDNLHEQIRLLINKKWEKLSTIPKPKKMELGNITHLYRWLKLPYSEIRCKVTGLPIGMQKDGSKFLCTNGVRFYYENYTGIWKYYLFSRLTDTQKCKSLHKQFEEISHSIRNEYNNKKHKTRKSIQKVLREPSLFDNLELLDKEKLIIAGYNNTYKIFYNFLYVN